MNVALHEGFEVIYIDPDSVFLEKQQAARRQSGSFSKRPSLTVWASPADARTSYWPK